MALERIVAQIHALSKDDQGLLQLRELLKSEEKEILKHKQEVPVALQHLNPAEHSYGYLCLLDIYGSIKDADQRYLDAALSFLQQCVAEQIRLSPQKIASLCKKVKEQSVLLQSPKQAIAPLLRALQQLEPGTEFITPIHACILQLCLLCKCYSTGASILTAEACEVDPSQTALTPTDFLLYCYYGAMIHIGRKNYKEALQMLLQAITAPTMVVNAITMAAYKKYILVSLIYRGTVPSQLPRFTASPVVRATKHDFPAYHELSEAYSNRTEALQKVLEKHNDALLADGNSGLVHLALEAKTKRAIQRLTQTYLTLSLQNIAETAKLPSAEVAEQHVLQMIESGDIIAQIDDSQGLVRFLEEPYTADDPELLATLDSQIAQSVKLAEKVKALNYEVSCDKQLISKMEHGVFT